MINNYDERRRLHFIKVLYLLNFSVGCVYLEDGDQLRNSLLEARINLFLTEKPKEVKDICRLGSVKDHGGNFVLMQCLELLNALCCGAFCYLS